MRIWNEAPFLSFLYQFFWQPLDIYGDSCCTLPRTLLHLLPRRSTIKFSVQCLCTLSVSDWKLYLCLVCLYCQNQILSPNSRSETEVLQFHKRMNLMLSGKEKKLKMKSRNVVWLSWKVCDGLQIFDSLPFKKLSDWNGKGLLVDCECEWLRRVIHEMIVANEVREGEDLPNKTAT